MVSASKRKLFPGTGLDVGLNTSEVIALRAPGFRGSARTRARARQQQSGTGGWHSGPTEHLHPANMQHQHSGNKREGAYGDVAPPKDSPTARIRGGYSLWPENPPSRLCLGLPTVPATVACVYLGLVWPITGSVEAGRPGGLPLPCTVHERLHWSDWSPYAGEPIGWGSKGPASRPAPPAPPPQPLGFPSPAR